MDCLFNSSHQELLKGAFYLEAGMLFPDRPGGSQLVSWTAVIRGDFGGHRSKFPGRCNSAGTTG